MQPTAPDEKLWTGLATDRRDPARSRINGHFYCIIAWQLGSSYRQKGPVGDNSILFIRQVSRSSLKTQACLMKIAICSPNMNRHIRRGNTVRSWRSRSGWKADCTNFPLAARSLPSGENAGNHRPVFHFADIVILPFFRDRRNGSHLDRNINPPFIFKLVLSLERSSIMTQIEKLNIFEKRLQAGCRHCRRSKPPDGDRAQEKHGNDDPSSFHVLTFRYASARERTVREFICRHKHLE